MPHSQLCGSSSNLLHCVCEGSYAQLCKGRKRLCQRTVSGPPGVPAAAASTNATPPSPTLTLPRPLRSAAPAPTSLAASPALSAVAPSCSAAWHVKLASDKGAVSSLLAGSASSHRQTIWKALAASHDVGTGKASRPNVAGAAQAPTEGTHSMAANIHTVLLGAPARAPAARRWAQRWSPAGADRCPRPTARRPPRSRARAGGPPRCRRARPRLRHRPILCSYTLLMPKIGMHQISAAGKVLKGTRKSCTPKKC